MLPTLDSYYQQIPFEEYRGKGCRRGDCNKRYGLLLEYMEPKGMTLIDICCANGYFPFRFMQDGGLLARGVEIDEKVVDFNNKLSDEKNMDFFTDIKLPDGKFDYGIYFDTHYHGDTTDNKYIDFLRDNVSMSFVSSSQGGKQDQFETLLKSKFKFVQYIGDSKAGRKIYLCEGKV